MKILVVYYSRTGTTRKVAESVCDKLNGNIEEIKDPKDRTGVVGYILSGWEAVRKNSPETKEIIYDPSDFDMVVIGTPVWAANMASPVRTYINKMKSNINDYALFCTYKGSGSKKTFTKMKDLINKEPLAEMEIIDKEIDDGSYLHNINEFIKKIGDN